MGSDVFRFDSILKIRENLRDSRRVQVEELLRQRDERSAERQTRCAERERNLLLWRACLEETPPRPDRLEAFRSHHDRLTAQVAETDQKIAELDAQLAIEQPLFAEAVRDVKILENLKERRHEEFLQTLRGREQNEADERPSKPT